jgi:drug/metabolite transporter (DMT)-like permease
MLLASALQREKASLVSSMIYSQVLWTILFQVFILNEPIVLLSIVGCALITLSAIFISINKSSYASSSSQSHNTTTSDSSSASYQLLPTRA